MSVIDHLRQDKDFFFRTDSHSPIPEEEREAFTGLKYFPYNDDLCFALEVDSFLWKTEMMIPTNIGEEAAYVRYGRIRFPVGGTEQTLTIYQSEGGLFMPFIDATCGEESYGGGRYLEPDIDEATGKCLVDFNLAYNPFCAYGDGWSCPVPPPENRLSVRIEAGERRYK